MVYTSKTEQFALVVFLAVFAVVIFVSHAYAEEELTEAPLSVEKSEVVQSDVQNTDPALPQENTQGEEVSQDTPAEVATSTEEVPPMPIEELPVTVTTGGEDSAELIEIPQVTIALETISQAIASSSNNDNLPFTLVTERMNFAINEVPVFTFSYSEEHEQGIVASFVDEVITNIGETISDLYEGSVVEDIVDAVVDTVDSVVDFFIPTAEGQELVPEEIKEEDVQAELPTLNDIQATTPPTVASSTETQSTSSNSVIGAEGTDGVVATTSTTTALVSFAVVDSIRYPVSLLYTEDNTFTVDMQSAVFGVGVHTLELHLLFKEKMYIAYYTFSVDGTVISTRVLKEGLTVLVVADQLGIQTLWLERLQENGVRSFQQIADETTMAQNPVLEFKDNTLFWTTPLKEALIGFDVVSNSSFSQTLNLRASEENSIELHNGTYDVSVTPEDIDVTFIPEKL